MRTEEKKRIDTLAKQSKETPPATPVETLPNPIEANTLAGAVEATPQAQEEILSANETKADTESTEIVEENGNSTEIDTSEIAQADEHDVPQPSIEVWAKYNFGFFDVNTNSNSGDCAWSRTK